MRRTFVALVAAPAGLALASAALAGPGTPIRQVSGVAMAISGQDSPAVQLAPDATVYDYTGTGPGYALTQPRPVDNGDWGSFTGASLGPGEMYQINSVTVARVHSNKTGSFDVAVLLWDDFDPNAAAGTPVFSGLLGGAVFNRSVTFQNANQVLTTQVGFDPGDILTDDPDFGYQMIYTAPNTLQINGNQVTYTPTTLGIGAFFVNQGATLAGTSEDAFLVDDNGDLILDSTEIFGFSSPDEAYSNVFLSVNASVVPEPVSASLLGLAALAGLRRRR